MPFVMLLKNRRVAVKVKADWKGRHKDYILMEEPLVMASEGTSFIPLPEGTKIFSVNHEPIPASGTFYISAETIDPYHLVIDYF